MEDRKSKFFNLLKKQKQRSSPVPSLPRNSQSSPFQRSQSFRHSPSPDRQGGDFLNVSRESAGSSSRVEELEVSIQEKNDIIQRLSSELEKVGREMDQMGVKLQEVQNNNLAEYSMVDQLKQLQETIRLQDQKLAHKQEESRMLEMTIGTLERENVARQNQTDSFDFRNLERLEEENVSLNEQLVKMEDALTVARMDAGDANEKIHNLEMKLNSLEKDKIDEEGVFNAKLEEYISKMSSQQKHAEDALVQLKTQNESLSKRLSSKEEEVKSLEEDKDKFRKELEDEIEYLLNEKNQMQSRHMEVYRAQERELTEKIESRDNEIENLKDENHALEEKLIEIQDIRNTSQNSDDEFQSAIEALQSTLQEKTLENDQLRDALERTVDMTGEQNQDLDKLKTENDNLGQRQAQLHDESLYHEQQYLQIETRLKEIESENKRLKSELDSVESLDLLAENESLKKQNENLHQLLANQQSDYANLSNQLSNQNEKLVDAKEATETRFETLFNNLQQSSKVNEGMLTERIQNLDDEVVRLNGIIEDSRVQAEALEKRIKSEIDSNSELKCQFHEIEAQLHGETIKRENIESEMKNVHQIRLKTDSESADLNREIKNQNHNLEEAKSTIEKLELESVASNEEIRKLKENSEKLEEDLSLLGLKVKDLELEVDEKSSQIGILESEKKNLVEVQSDLESQIVKVRNDAETFFAETSKTQSDAKEYKEQVNNEKEALLLQITDLKTSNTNLQRDISCIQEKASRLEEVEAENQLLKTQNVEIESARTQERENFAAELKNSHLEIEELSKDYEKFASQLQDKDEQIHHMENIRDDLHGRIEENTNLQTIIDENRKVLESMNDKLAEKTTENSSLEEDIKLLNSKISSFDLEQSEREEVLEARQNAANLEIDQLKSNIRELNESNEFIKRKNEEYQEEVDILKEVKSNLEKNLEELEEEKNEFIRQIENIKIELVNEKATLPDLQMKLTQSQTEFEELKANYETLTTRKNNLETELDSRNEDLTGNTAQIAFLTKDVADKVDIITRLEADHNTLADDNEKLLNEVEKCHTDLENGSEQLEIIRVQLSNSKLNYDTLHEKHSELLEDQIKKIEEMQLMGESLESYKSQVQKFETKVQLLETANQQLDSKLIDYGEISSKCADNEQEVHQLIVDKSELQELVDRIQLENGSLKKTTEQLEKQLSEKSEIAQDKEKLIGELQGKFEELSADFNQKELLTDELDRLRAEMMTEEEQLTRKEMEINIEKQKDEIFLLSNQIEEIQANLTDTQAQKDELIQKLTEAEASRNQIQSDAKQMADELVAQYNRFQTEQDELKSGLEKAHGEQLRQASEQFENEKNTLLENFSEKYQHLESENETKLSEFKEQIGQIRDENEKFQQTISELNNELKTSVAQNQEREAEMDALTQDLADLIPVSENLKKENDHFKLEIESLKQAIEEGETERIQMLSHIESENKKTEQLRIEINGLNSEIESKIESEKKLQGQVDILRGTIEKLGCELNEYRAMNMSMTTNGTNTTQYIPIVPNQLQVGAPQVAGMAAIAPPTPDDSVLTEGSLPDSEIGEMDNKDIEIMQLKEQVEKLKEEVVRLQYSLSQSLSQSQSRSQTTSLEYVTAGPDDGLFEGPLEDTFLPETKIEASPIVRITDKNEFEEKLEELEREREDQLMAKNDQLESLEETRQNEKKKASEIEEKLRAKVKELNEALDKAQGFNENGPLVAPENVTTEEVLELKSQNEFLQKQAEEFADELEKTINSEDDLSKENILLQKQLVDLKTELEAIKTETPERFERLMHGFGNERKEFDEAHEKVYDDNEQLRKALVKINSKVKEFTNVINKEHNASVDMSQIEQYPIEDEEMEIEEGVAVTEQVVNLLDQMIKQGEFASPAPSSPVKADRPGSQRFTEIQNLRTRVETLEEDNAQLNDRVQAIVAENFASVDEQTRKIFEMTQAQHFAERNQKDDKIRRLEDEVHEARSGLSDHIHQLKRENGDLISRNEHLERDIESKIEFVETQSKEQEAERVQQEEKIKTLQSALTKLRNENRVRKFSSEEIPNFPGFEDFKNPADQRQTMEIDTAKLHETEFEVSNYKGREVPLQERIEKLEKDLQRERENRDNIQTDYNLLCQKLEMTEEENRTLKNEKSEVFSEKEVMEEELRLAYARISELEIFIDRIKLGNQSRQSRSNTSLSDSTQNLSKSTSNLRPFQDETKLNETPSLSLHNLALGDYPQPSPAEANQHHADLLEDLAEKSKIIEKLESEIDTLRTELEETRDHLDRALQSAPASAKSSNGASPREPKKSVHSLLEDLSERENQIYEKEEELFELQDEIQKLKNENQNLKEKLSEVLNQNFNLTGQETFTVEDPNPTFESMAPETHSQATPSGGMNMAELEEELLKAKDENEELISKNHLLEDKIDDLNYLIKKLKKESSAQFTSSPEISPRDKRRASSPRRGPDEYSLSDSISDLELDTPNSSFGQIDKAEGSQNSANKSRDARSRSRDPRSKSKDRSYTASRHDTSARSRDIDELSPRSRHDEMIRQNRSHDRSTHDRSRDQNPDISYERAQNRSHRSDKNRSLNDSNLSTRSADRSRARLESDLIDKQREIATLEKIVEELNTELQSSQAKLTDFIESNKQAREQQRRDIEQWRQDQITKMVSPESHAELQEKLIESHAQLDEVSSERVLVIDELEKIRNRVHQLQVDKRELKDSCDILKEEVRLRDENIDRLQDQNIREYEDEITNLRSELDRMHQDFQDQGELTDTIDNLTNELDGLRSVYQESKETIASLKAGQANLKKDSAENLQRLQREIEDNRDKSIHIDELEARLRTDDTLKVVRDQLKADNEKLHKELEKASNKIIQHEIRQKDQQETITNLFKEIEEHKAELDEIQNTSRCSDASSAKSQSELMKEINALKESLSFVTIDRDNKLDEIKAMRSRCHELEKQLDEQLRNVEISGRGEELISRLQAELDQQEELDEKIMSHFNMDSPSASSQGKNSGKLQQLLDRVCDEGTAVFNLSELLLHKDKSDSEKHFEMENLIRRFESKIEQEKLINSDLQESLRREQSRIHDQERRADCDKKMIESLQTQLAQSSRELGDKCVEVSRCLAEIGVIKQELIDKTNLLHASQEMIDNLRTDAEKMRQEFSNYDQMITNTKYETEELELELTEKKNENEQVLSDLSRAQKENEKLKSDLIAAKRKFDEISSKSSASSELESELRSARQAEEAERKLNQQLNQQLKIEIETVASLKNKMSDLEHQSSTESRSSSDKLSSKLKDLTHKLEQHRLKVQEANLDRDRQAELRMEVESKMDAGLSREKRLISKVQILEERLLNISNDSDQNSGDEKTSLQTVRHGLELARQSLSSLSARLQVATVRSDTTEIETCRNELTDQHRTLTLIARTLNSTRSSKRAKETGVLEARLQEQLHALEESNNRIVEMQESTHNQEFTKLQAMHSNFASQIETLKIERKSALSQLDEYRSKLVKLELELERKENEQPQSTSSSSGTALVRKQQKTYERYARAESARKALVYQKKYLLLIIGGFQETEESTLKLISKMGGQPSQDLAVTPRKKPIMRFRAAVRACIAVHRLEFLRKKWQKTITRTRSSSKDVVSTSVALAHRQSSRPLIEHHKY